MKSSRQTVCGRRVHAGRERGSVVFVALIALVTIMLAAVALTRSVDTTTIISGNLAFKQSATAGADAGVEAAIKWMTETNNTNAGKDPFIDDTNAFNKTHAAEGYYSNADPALALTADSTWVDGISVSIGTDPKTQNSVRYLIQRMCRDADQKLSEANCLFSDVSTDTNSHNPDLPPIIGGKRPLNRVTVRVTGPRNTVSYTQAYIY